MGTRWQYNTERVRLPLPCPPTFQERQDINSQMTAAVTAVQLDCMGAEQAGQDAASSRDHMLPKTESLESRQEQLEQQEALTNRLNLLLHKEVGLHRLQVATGTPSPLEMT